jgi:integrase
LLKKHGLPEVRLYDTRHSHATALLTKGVNLAWVSDRLGHSDVKMTRDVYAHVLPEAHKEMAEVMERIVTAMIC